MSRAPVPTWEIAYQDGSVQDLHQRAYELLGSLRRRTVLVQQPSGVALALGSARGQAQVDDAACAAAGVGVSRRRSGGGAVLVGPGELVWVDFLVPEHDPLWEADVARSAWWLGDAWARALAGLGLHGADVWRGPLQQQRWSGTACFGALAGGEVTLKDRKVVGVSQRRSRLGALLQSACLLRWRPADLLSLLRLSEGDRREAQAALEPVATGVGTGRRGEVVASLLDVLP